MVGHEKAHNDVLSESILTELYPCTPGTSESRVNSNTTWPRQYLWISFDSFLSESSVLS